MLYFHSSVVHSRDSQFTLSISIHHFGISVALQTPLANSLIHCEFAFPCRDFRFHAFCETTIVYHDRKTRCCNVIGHCDSLQYFGGLSETVSKPYIVRSLLKPVSIKPSYAVRFTLLTILSAAWSGARVTLQQVSPESPIFFDLIVELYRSCNGEWSVLLAQCPGK